MPIHRVSSLYISPHDDCHAALLDVARAAHASIHVLVFGFTLPDLASILIEKKAAGVNIGIVVDRMQTSGRKQKALMQHLVNNHVPVTITTSHGLFMHMKVLIADYDLGVHHNMSRIAHGSYNFTKPAQGQINSLLIQNDPTVVQYMFTVYEQAKSYGELHYEQLHPVTSKVRRLFGVIGRKN